MSTLWCVTSACKIVSATATVLLPQYYLKSWNTNVHFVHWERFYPSKAGVFVRCTGATFCRDAVNPNFPKSLLCCSCVLQKLPNHPSFTICPRFVKSGFSRHESDSSLGGFLQCKGSTLQDDCCFRPGPAYLQPKNKNTKKNTTKIQCKCHTLPDHCLCKLAPA